MKSINLIGGTFIAIAGDVPNVETKSWGEAVTHVARHCSPGENVIVIANPLSKTERWPVERLVDGLASTVVVGGGR